MTLPVLSGSMMPHLPPGGRIQVECSPSLEPRLGDIIVFRDADRLVAHRLLLRLRVGRRYWLYQKGDAAGIGSWVRGDRLVGVVTRASSPQGEGAYVRRSGCRPAGSDLYRHLGRDLAARARRLLRPLRLLLGGRGAARGVRR